MILSPVASFSQSFSPFELTATHFGSETVIFGRPQNTNICYQTINILIFASVCIANVEICIADTNICLKDTNYMWQIQISIYQKYINDLPSSVLLGAFPQGLFFSAKIHFLYFINRESSFLCLEYIKRGLSKPCAPGCAPAGAFFPSKNSPSRFYKQRASVFGP